MLAARGRTLVPADRIADMVLTLAFGAVIGGRLGYALFYDPMMFISVEPGFPFWSLLFIHAGGMSSHGGILGVIVAAYLVARGVRDEHGQRVGACSPLHVLDLVAFVAPLGLMFGRLANFVNGELLGRIVAMPGEVAPWWAVRSPQELLSGHRPELDAVQTRELWRLVETFRLPGMDDEDAIVAMIASIQHGSVEVNERLTPLLAARHPSQLYQAAAEGLVLGLVLVIVWARPRVQGVVGAWFMMVYGILRLWTETMRLPDDHLKIARLLGLTRGQWLSVAMVVVGACVLAWAVRRGGEKIGGLMARSSSSVAA
jgi:phosphatidylglycerol:prolipoprotein diacylglycerol transferase